MKVLVFGRSGQVASALAAYDGVVCLGRKEADLADPAACAAQVRATDAQAVINAAAYTAVDDAENRHATAMLINGDSPSAMAAAAAARDLPFVQISTDYVFDGAGTLPYAPDAPTAPMSVYGASKLAGEDGVRLAGGRHAILRTSWVFSATGKNFVKTMVQLGATRDHLSIVADQIGGPTSARAIAQACMHIARQLIKSPDKTGTYHFSGSPDVSWADFAREIFAQSGLDTKVTDITTADYPTPAKRPFNSRLDCTTTKAAFGLEQPEWKLDLAAVISQLSDPNKGI